MAFKLLGLGPQKTTRTQTTTPTRPAEVEAAAKDLLKRSQDFADQPFTPYTAQRIAEFTPDEQAAFSAAREIADVSRGLSGLTPELTREGVEATRSLAQRLPDVDISEYMSPYTEAVLDPVIRDIEEKAARERLRLGQQSARTGSFGGSRQAIAESELERGTQRNIGEESARQRAAAYTNALSQFRADQERIPQLYSGALSQLSTGLAQTGQRLNTEVNPLLQTGGAQRALEQAGLDFDYSQFEKEENYPLRGIEVLRNAVNVSPQALGIGSTGTTTETKPGPGLLQTLGGAALASGLGGSLPSLGLSFLSGLGGGAGGIIGNPALDPNYSDNAYGPSLPR
jgi:hypothetical protein